MYSREINGQEYSFGVSGKLIMNVLVMYDRQTGSLWSQLLGEAVEGELQGTRLEYLPSWMTTWEDWRTRHPDTLALKISRGGNNDPYESYYASRQTGVIGESSSDDRLYVKEFVIGVEIEGQPVAYPFSILNQQPVINDEIGGRPILVVFNADTGTGVVFDRQVDEQLLTFELLDGQQLRDTETGSIWDGLSGTAIDGPLSGARLERIKSTASFWFGWKDFYPQTEVYGIGE